MLNLRTEYLPNLKLQDTVRIIQKNAVTFGKEGVISATYYSKEKPFIVSFDSEWIGYYTREDLEKI